MAKKKDLTKLTVEEAIELLDTHKEKNKLRVHSMIGGGGFIMGCDMDLIEVKNEFNKSKHICIAGVTMRGINHAVAYHNEERNMYVFLQTNSDKINQLVEQRKIV